jgi:quercetin dioxygenase-like cupin family protein
MIKITRPDQQAGAQKSGPSFTGTVLPYVIMPSTDGVSLNNVTFTPGARTFWHHHERGQILQVISGRGLIQSAGEPSQTIRAGDVIWIPPGDRHWHGAAPDSPMTHTAISMGVTTWEDEVSQADYIAPPA